MSKEKFEVLFLAGGALLDMLGHRLRRAPVTPREMVGVAMHTVETAFEEHRAALADPQAVATQIRQIRAELCAEPPHALVLSAYLDELASQVRDAGPLAEAVDVLRTAVRDVVG